MIWVNGKNLDSFLFPDIDEVDLSHRSLTEIAEERYCLKPTSGRQTFRIGYA